MAKEKILNVFIDESGNFDDISDPARYCIVTLVLHDKANDISRYVQEMNRANEDIGVDAEVFQFHTSPLIRQEGVFAAMSRRMRGRLLDRMMTFVREVDFRYCCFDVDTSFVNTPAQEIAHLKQKMIAAFDAHKSSLQGCSQVVVYYDAGQKAVGKLLEDVFANAFTCPVKYVQGVRQGDYKLLQVADLICTARLLELKLNTGCRMNISEQRFFGGPRDFKRNILKKLKAKEL